MNIQKLWTVIRMKLMYIQTETRKEAVTIGEVSWGF